MEAFWKRANRLFEGCQDLLRREKIPASQNLLPLRINPRAKSRFGCCRIVGGAYQIEISTNMEMAADRDIETVLLHELLHTCPGCMNHGKLWKEYAARVNGTYGYKISSTSRYGDFGLKEPERKETARYLIRCRECGMEIRRKRRSRLVEYTDKYRCGKCGGKLDLHQITLHLVDEKKSDLW